MTLKKPTSRSPRSLARKDATPAQGAKLGSRDTTNRTSRTRSAAVKDLGVARALRARFNTVIERVIETADPAMLERAVAAPTDLGAVARAISESATSLASVAELDPLAAAYARGAEQKAQLLKACGGTLSVNEVATLLGVSRQAIDKRRREGKLIAVPKGADFAYPAIQFEDGAVVPGLQKLLAELESASWVALQFLMAPSEQLSGHSPLQVLKSGTEEERRTMLRMARIQAGDGFG
jgi:hypothetical protein